MKVSAVLVVSSLLRRAIRNARLGCGLLILLAPSLVIAHPHAWVDSQYEVQVDSPTLDHIQANWSLDVFTSTALIEDYDRNGDGQFTGEERTELLEALHNFDQYGYFVHLKVDGQAIKPKAIKITGVGMKQQMMWMTLDIALPEPVNLEASTLSLAFGDDTYFFAMIPLEEGLVQLSGKLAETCTPMPREATEKGIESWVDLTCGL